MVKRIFSVLLMVGFLAAMVIGASMASAADYSDYDKKKVKICHKGKTIEVSYQGWVNGHKGHHDGDYYGPCKPHSYPSY